MYKFCKQKKNVYYRTMKKIFILTGEPSGDKLASKVISMSFEICHNLQISSTIFSMINGFIRDGVPPPKKMLLIDRSGVESAWYLSSFK